MIVHGLIGDSAATRDALQFIEKVSGTTATVLIRGESGTGKELVARAIHQNSARAAGPFVALNCGAVPETLLESELFGFERGAFTGAVMQKKGRIEAADRGTLFLDEVGEMPPPMQIKFLRVLQEREFERVGGLKRIPVNVRIVAATHRDLENAVECGDFRADLYYRLKVLCFKLAPLRNRREDIIPLARHFIAGYAKLYAREVDGISYDAIEVLTRYDWPGNIRELQHAIESAVVLASESVIQKADLPPEIVVTPPRSLVRAISGLERIRRQIERFVIENALTWAGGHCKKAAQYLEIHEKTLSRYIHEFNLSSLVKGTVT
jgi:Nif-specific regulatory protein